MERFCDKCGTLVSGEGTFCPQCGAPMTSAVNLSKPSDSSSMGTITPGIDAGLAPGQHPETDEYFSGSGDPNANYNTADTPMPSVSMDTVMPGAANPAPASTPAPTPAAAPAPAPMPNPTPVQNTNYAQMPNYPQYSNVGSNNSNVQEMTIGQWVGTILLGGCLGIISIILLFVWAFGDTPQPKKNYARASLIIQAVALALYLILVIGTIACTGSLFGAEFWDEIAY